MTENALADIDRIKNSARKFPVDIYETQDAFVMKADLPGVSRDDLTIQVIEGRLRIASVRRSPGTTSYLRVFHLPEGVSSAETQAYLKDGVLTVKLPKPDRMMPTRIPVMADSNVTI